MPERKKILQVRNKFEGDLIKIWNLPYDYEVEYIERDYSIEWIENGSAVTGGFDLSQYIPLEQTLNNQSHLTTEWCCENNTSIAIGTQFGVNLLSHLSHWKTMNTTKYSFGINDSNKTNVESNIDRFCRMDTIPLGNSKMRLMIDGMFVNDYDQTTTGNIQIFKVLTTTVTTTNTQKARVRSVKYGTTVDLIPVVKGNSVGFYNKVDGSLILSDQACLKAGARKVYPLYDAEVEWIETDGLSSYIDTGVLVDWWNQDSQGVVPGSTVQVTFQFPSIPPVESNYGPCVCGARNRAALTDTMFCIVAQHTSSQNRVITRTPNITSDTPLTPIDTNVHNVIMADKVTIDGVEYTSSTTFGDRTNRFFMLGCSGDPSLLPIDHSSWHAANVRIYYVKILDGNENVKFDAIPVRKDGSGYLYDRISGRIFGNSGYGGTITAGPDK